MIILWNFGSSSYMEVIVGGELWVSHHWKGEWFRAASREETHFLLDTDIKKYPWLHWVMER